MVLGVFATVCGQGAFAYQLKIDSAHLVAQVDRTPGRVGEQALSDWGLQNLPWKWDSAHPESQGILKASYRFSTLDLEVYGLDDSQSLAVYTERFANRYRYSLNNQPWIEVGWHKANTTYKSKPQLLTLDAAFLQEHNELRIEIRAEPTADISAPYLLLGSPQDIKYRYHKYSNDILYQALIIGTVSIIIALISGILGMILLDRANIFAMISQLLFAYRSYGNMVDYPFVPTWMWNASLAWSYLGAILVFLMLVASTLKRRQTRHIIKLKYVTICSFFLMESGYYFGLNHIYQLEIMLVFVFCCASYYSLYVDYKRERGTGVASLLLIAPVLFGFVAYDYARVLSRNYGYLMDHSEYQFAPYSGLLLSVFIAGLIINRYVAVNNYLFHGAVQSRYAAELAQGKERQRLLKELHDAVGTRLHALQNLIQSTTPNYSFSAVSQLAASTVDELRIAINSIRCANAELTLTLAEFRRIIQPRLNAQNIHMHWAIEVEHAGFILTDKYVLIVQKILQEIFMNALQHAQAKNMDFAAKIFKNPLSSDLYAEISVTDDGRGFDVQKASEEQGSGLKLMLSMAQSAGIHIDVQSAPERMGTMVKLAFAAPIKRSPTHIKAP